jgi:hypothetical protein
MGKHSKQKAVLTAGYWRGCGWAVTERMEGIIGEKRESCNGTKIVTV